jgi:hypothetical protein
MNVLVTTVYTPIIKLKEAWVIILQSCVVLRPLMSSSIAGHTAHIAQRGSTGSRQPFDPTQPTHDASAMPCRTEAYHLLQRRPWVSGRRVPDANTSDMP